MSIKSLWSDRLGLRPNWNVVACERLQCVSPLAGALNIGWVT